LLRDTSACKASRTAAGLGGFWLKFSCRVTLGRDAQQVQLESDGRPDYPSNYFPSGDACHEDYTPSFPDPNLIAIKSLTMKVPVTPMGAGSAMGLGAVGLAINGVEIFDNQAAQGDDIYLESKSFDRCQGHPSGKAVYHYHSEPYSISIDDANLIGVMLDGYPIYGRRDPDGSVPTTLDVAGGHLGPTLDAPTPVYHYHVNQQTSTTPGTAGQSVWFITKGWYAASPGACAGC
jgi:hypothetical protein